jgi:hypothetical protein
MASVEARLAFKGDGAERLIDEVLLFHYFTDGWEREQELHALFTPEKLFPCGSWIHMPLHKNGQSELYGADILQLDHRYTEQQLKDVEDNVLVFDTTSAGDRNAVRARISARRAREKSIAEGAAKNKAAFAAFRQRFLVRALTIVLKPVVLLLAWGTKPLVKFSNSPKPQRDFERMDELRMELSRVRRQQLRRSLGL